MYYFHLARKYAAKKDHRSYIFGAVAKRRDGTLVFSRNIPNCEKNWHCHAEARISRKLDIGAIVYVVRVSRETGKLICSRPCQHCEKALRQAGVRRCLYSISETEYGVLEF